ncbi:class I SAM-dependent methyltransferase [Rhizobium paknamense]|uniref:SAM-dependent methyltransferase n=1 Tax=Rhizobium paknamense TaxID=1206817 RepID=A0ABU0IJR4_9HYPH|nr:class I SAM-dependent methyltransferase [Rhizobium paknamense]MDQ0457476.1 SAM-dependent methyltransferase [Rhizobium paknamense]
MNDAEQRRWNSRFDTDDYVFGEAPNAFLRTHAPAPNRGRALCVADGEGRNGLWLAEQGWQVVSLDFSAVAQRKAEGLAIRRGVSIELVHADVHAWQYPVAAYDLVVDIFSQFSSPDQRARKWAAMKTALRPGGHLVVQGYTPEQLRHRTGGPGDPAQLYTREMLLSAFGEFEILKIVEEEVILDEGSGHSGPSAVIGLVARKG